MRKKIPLFILLKAMGLTKKKIYFSLKNTEFLEKIELPINYTIEKALVKISRQ